MRYLGFLLIMLTVLSAGYGYIGWRLATPMGKGRKRRTVWLVVVGTAVFVMGSFWGRMAGAEGKLSDAIAWLGFSALGFSSLVFTLVVIRDVLLLVARVSSWVSRRAAPGKMTQADRERRRFLLQSLNAGKLGTSSLMVGYGFFAAHTQPSVVQVTVPIVDLPDVLVGFQIAQISDLHIGPTIKHDYVRAVVDQVNQLGADMVALTGDLVDGSVSYLAEDCAPLGELRSTHGSFVCTGNHEYYSGVHQWLPHFAKLGMTVLLDEHRAIDIDGARLLVAGVADYSAPSLEPQHASSPAQAMAGAPECDVKLLLAHQPRSIFEAAKAGFDIQLSGHTHGGQFFPWNFVAHLVQPYVQGLHRHEGTWIYVSRGAGYWGPPIRILAPSEITLLKLARA